MFAQHMWSCGFCPQQHTHKKNFWSMYRHDFICIDKNIIKSAKGKDIKFMWVISSVGYKEGEWCGVEVAKKILAVCLISYLLKKGCKLVWLIDINSRW
jgi:hypothetical protein